MYNCCYFIIISLRHFFPWLLKYFFQGTVVGSVQNPRRHTSWQELCSSLLLALNDKRGGEFPLTLRRATASRHRLGCDVYRLSETKKQTEQNVRSGYVTRLLCRPLCQLSSSVVMCAFVCLAVRTVIFPRRLVDASRDSTVPGLSHCYI